MAGYLLGTLVTSLFVVSVILGGCFYLSRSYGWVLTTVFKIWFSSTKEKEMRSVILKKCDEVVKELKDNGARIEKLQEEKLQEEKLQEEKLQEEKLQEEKLQEEKLQSFLQEEEDYPPMCLSY